MFLKKYLFFIALSLSFLLPNLSGAEPKTPHCKNFLDEVQRLVSSEDSVSKRIGKFIRGFEPQMKRDLWRVNENEEFEFIQSAAAKHSGKFNLSDNTLVIKGNEGSRLNPFNNTRNKTVIDFDDEKRFKEIRIYKGDSDSEVLKYTFEYKNGQCFPVEVRAMHPRSIALYKPVVNLHLCQELQSYPAVTSPDPIRKDGEPHPLATVEQSVIIDIAKTLDAYDVKNVRHHDKINYGAKNYDLINEVEENGINVLLRWARMLWKNCKSMKSVKAALADQKQQGISAPQKGSGTGDSPGAIH